jgi:AraC-like DNA-binding protein
MDGDPLADVLTLASARCVRIGTLKAGGTWALKFPPPQKIKLTAIVKGACWFAVDGESAPLRLKTGDIFMVPAERSYVLASDLTASQMDGLALFMKATDNVGRVGDGQDFLAIGGHVALDPDRGGLLADVLPPVIHVDANSSEASTIRWLLDQLVKEVTANRPGAVLASKQLAQLLFVQIIRFYLAAATNVTAGWLRALNDERVAPALRLMHAEPGRAWRLGELAKQVGMSRTSFALRFKANAGVAPLTYLQNLRMRLAEQRLREGAMSVAELGESLGYESDSAFSNAFKRRTGMAPRHYRSVLARMDQPTSDPTGPNPHRAPKRRSLTPPASTRHRQTARRH